MSLGTAQEAAAALGVSIATLHRMRAAATLVIDHRIGRVLRELTPDERVDRRWQKRQHLVAPALFAQQLPGRPWLYDLERLRQQATDGPPEAEWGDAREREAAVHEQGPRVPPPTGSRASSGD